MLRMPFLSARRTIGTASAAVLLIALPASLAAAPAAPFAELDTHYSYAQLADLVTAAPVVLSVDIVRAVPLKGAEAQGVKPGDTRYYIEAAVQALIGGRAELPATVRYLVDLPSDGHRPLKLKGVGAILLAAPTSRPGELRLVGPRAQVPRTPENDAQVRAILTAAGAPDAPPAIKGIAHAFHVAGTLPGEGETQIFLKTADDRPISLSILRRPGEQPRWAVALSELVDASAAPPKPDSFLWYRLACGLPPRLPDNVLAGQDPDDARIAREDYQTVLKGLGPCNGAYPHPRDQAPGTPAAQNDESSTPTPRQSG